MAFDKIVTIGIAETSLANKYWAQIDKLAAKRVSLPKESPEISKELADADCLLVGFGVQTDKSTI